jgi:phage terminase large subunit GpA-like protein
MRLERLLVDQGYSTDTIYQFCRQSKHAGVVMPSKGMGIGAKSEPMREYKKKPGDRTGLNWRIPAVKGGRTVRTCLHDTNYWKSFIHARLCVAMGDRGCLSLFGEKPYQHRLFAEHICYEYRTRTMGRGRELDEWVERPGRPDNHWLDCLSGAAVAASIQGAVLPEAQADHPVKAKANRVSFAELQRQQQMKG